MVQNTLNQRVNVKMTIFISLVFLFFFVLIQERLNCYAVVWCKKNYAPVNECIVVSNACRSVLAFFFFVVCCLLLWPWCCAWCWVGKVEKSLALKQEKQNQKQLITNQKKKHKSSKLGDILVILRTR